jgi:AcrR family transcriptional regulator
MRDLKFSSSARMLPQHLSEVSAAALKKHRYRAHWHQDAVDLRRSIRDLLPLSDRAHRCFPPPLAEPDRTAMPDTDDAAERPVASLRERKKALTHKTIADAAFDLVLTRGLDDVTVDQIADRAFVSPRTVSNYFSSKEAAVVASGDTPPIVLIAGMSERPADEPPLTSLREVLVENVRAWTPEQLDAIREKEQLIERFHALLPHRMAQYDELEDAIREVVAERSGVDPETAPFPRLIAGAATAVVKTAIRVWVNTDGDRRAIAELVEHGFHDLEAGLTPEH